MPTQSAGIKLNTEAPLRLCLHLCYIFSEIEYTFVNQ